MTPCELPRGRTSFGLDTDLRFDLLLLRHRGRVRAALESFRPDLIHASPAPETWESWERYWPGRCAFRWRFPWHTNIHEFGARRLGEEAGVPAGELATAYWSAGVKRQLLA